MGGINKQHQQPEETVAHSVSSVRWVVCCWQGGAKGSAESATPLTSLRLACWLTAPVARYASPHNTPGSARTFSVAFNSIDRSSVTCSTSPAAIMAPEDLGPKIFQVNVDAPVSAHPYVSMTSPFLRSHAFSAVHFNRATQLPPCNLTMYLALYTTVPCRSRRDLTFREAFARRSYRGHTAEAQGLFPVCALIPVVCVRGVNVSWQRFRSARSLVSLYQNHSTSSQSRRSTAIDVKPNRCGQQRLTVSVAYKMSYSMVVCFFLSGCCCCPPCWLGVW